MTASCVSLTVRVQSSLPSPPPCRLPRPPASPPPPSPPSCPLALPSPPSLTTTSTPNCPLPSPRSLRHPPLSSSSRTSVSTLYCACTLQASYSDLQTSTFRLISSSLSPPTHKTFRTDGEESATGDESRGCFPRDLLDNRDDFSSSSSQLSGTSHDDDSRGERRVRGGWAGVREG